MYLTLLPYHCTHPSQWHTTACFHRPAPSLFWWKGTALRTSFRGRRPVPYFGPPGGAAPRERGVPMRSCAARAVYRALRGGTQSTEITHAPWLDMAGSAPGTGCRPLLGMKACTGRARVPPDKRIMSLTQWCMGDRPRKAYLWPNFVF